MSSLILRYLEYVGPEKRAGLTFAPGLNVICGASETGKSLIVESIDFMLGQEEPARDIPEKEGYDRIRLAIESKGWPTLLLERSIEGGHFRDYQDGAEPRVLRWQHSAARQDTLSFELLSRVGLLSKTIRRSRTETRSLSFRDLARLCIVTEEEIQRRGSPLLSGQFTTATGEYAAFKLLLTGMDDSSLTSTKETTSRREQDIGKIDLLTSMIEELQTELNELGADESELTEQLTKLVNSVDKQNANLSQVQRQLDGVLEQRRTAASEWQTRKDRIAEIDEMLVRFKLLDEHYASDLKRLEAVRESGSIFVHLDQQPCPLCGALPDHQHLDSDCEGNTEAVTQAATQEIQKVSQLRTELSDTMASISHERSRLEGSLAERYAEFRAREKELAEIVRPAISTARTSYNNLVTERADVKSTLDKFARLKRLIDQRSALDGADESGDDATTSRTIVPKNSLDEFAQTVQRILQEWHFPNAARVFFDETKRDFQIAGKSRGSTGKGLRAITHAAVTIGLMEFCRERGLPHPGFVVLDSPLLAYWKPEGNDDDLRGSDLKDMFYRYLLGIDHNIQVIIVENEHPPKFVMDAAPVTVFTKNPGSGRYGFL